MNRRGILRGSTRSRDSSSLSDEIDTREKIKDCFRKFIAFMCTQIGVGALIVCYTIIGALSFSKIESSYNDTSIQKVEMMRCKYTKQLWIVAKNNNILNRTAFYLDSNNKLKHFQNEIVLMIKSGYDGNNAGEMWSVSAALMFSLSIITMIGYGTLVPKTPWGKFATVIYAFFGIPLFVLYFLNFGEILAGCFKYVYTWLYQCTKKAEDKFTKRVIVPSTACLWVVVAYIITGSLMFANWEHWSYLDSAYFCVTSLCKLGFGDFVPGAASKDGNETKLVITFIYILVGFGIVAMCFNLMREEILVKIEEMKEDFRQCLEDTRLKMMDCCGRKEKIDEF